ncbi:GTP-binding protein [Tuwongella immobilis]|uniref:CobW/HypB/UreG nucleotide-binding domain-containing protein n=1 Tax=Tuwongella immobilis TaxID=692036 RepID=A0A6C2YMQ9_9BACT|nr:GTP-binding protein [Tuwongella immobilis]VIP02880.1 Cobalamin synthesis protein P47K OS=Pirellula staleyi (strain ATCC 27377 / DSM 6068 / ICPB 4128) GN=Psta_1415 PE=4 SV=1: cobW [Tuwongella immobilis]VTS02728.1 Cobalamin synthesis protein P47K OS=Pirellula staleyi (strain ATCC 27377 / DSM 6068 / ICPB 4128) GN=Psta_1415 PE=4 SV=1: cobW [Tuwongella immobilis]
MANVRFVLLGGFLGAGKTTTLARLARHYTGLGHRVGIVTNDQAQDLVDTNNLRSQGFSVQEVPGACFCCKFDDLIGQIGQLQADQRPDIILAEPVGSCTDLVATVVQPMRDLYGSDFRVAPYAVLFKPSHGLKILRNEAKAGFSPKAAYIFRKQLEEADAIVMNRIDELSPADLDELTQLLTSEYPGVPLIPMSAKTGQGFEQLVALLDQEGAFGQRVLDIDYDVYAEGEAELGWLNLTASLSSEQAFDLDALLMKLIQPLAARLAAVEAEAAHLKLIGLDREGGFGVANLVSSQTGCELSLPSQKTVPHVDLVVNARVAIDPSILESAVREVLAEVSAGERLTLAIGNAQSLRPGRPVPTHRYSQAKA